MYEDEDNDGRFPDKSRVEVRYPRSRQEEQRDRARWPWLPGTIVEQCGPDEWYVCSPRSVCGVGRGRAAAEPAGYGRAVRAVPSPGDPACRPGHRVRQWPPARERDGMSMRPYGELPWWCQLLWPWFGPPGMSRSKTWTPSWPRTGARCTCQRPDWLSCWLAMTRQVRATWPRQGG